MNTKPRTYVGIRDVKDFLKSGGKKKDLANFMGYATETSIDKWIARRRIPRWQQKRVWEYLMNWEREQSLKVAN